MRWPIRRFAGVVIIAPSWVVDAWPSCPPARRMILGAVGQVLRLRIYSSSSSAYLDRSSSACVLTAALQLLGRVLDRLDDFDVAGAAAQIARDAPANFLLGRVGVLRSSALALIIMPGVQKPHCRPCFSQKPSWSGCSWPPCATPSMVSIAWPSACTANMVQLLTPCRPAAPCRRRSWSYRSRYACRSGPASQRMKWTSSMRDFDLRFMLLAVYGDADMVFGHSFALDHVNGFSRSPNGFNGQAVKLIE